MTKEFYVRFGGQCSWSQNSRQRSEKEGGLRFLVPTLSRKNCERMGHPECFGRSKGCATRPPITTERDEVKAAGLPITYLAFRHPNILHPMSQTRDMGHPFISGWSDLGHPPGLFPLILSTDFFSVPSPIRTTSAERTFRNGEMRFLVT